jgi:hypothetical protein
MRLRAVCPNGGQVQRSCDYLNKLLEHGAGIEFYTGDSHSAQLDHIPDCDTPHVHK